MCIVNTCHMVVVGLVRGGRGGRLRVWCEEQVQEVGGAVGGQDVRGKGGWVRGGDVLLQTFEVWKDEVYALRV